MHRLSPSLSPWSRSPRKRTFDLACVLCSLPITLPILLCIALLVRLTSPGSILFRQKRMGLHGRTFTIYKFRTMPLHRGQSRRPDLTTSINQRFTPIGPFLRRWKLDELPQLFNVLRGNMSLVGPRPKLPRLQPGSLSCRPGITGRATLVFAREEVALSSVPNQHLDAYYYRVVRPLKQSLDEQYMARATFASDFIVIARSILRRWGHAQTNQLAFDQAAAIVPG
jgi:lipopolysaccharide/colanic/teichoic acid biosynthesis glycosyltransferase